MFHYKIYKDNGKEFLFGETEIPDWDNAVRKVMMEMDPVRLKGKKEDWFYAVVRELCARYNLKQCTGPAFDAEEYKEDLEDLRRTDYSA